MTEPAVGSWRLGLPGQIEACLFDLDGVLTDTATVHAKAWKLAFDQLLKGRGDGSFTAFDEQEDYRKHVDGKPRLNGVRDFLASRGITLLEGSPGDAPATRRFTASATARTRSSVTASAKTAYRSTTGAGATWRRATRRGHADACALSA
ncbi:MAG: hypothetical protein NVS3B26_13900 [Mycobacteriales bacterium]